MIAYRRVSRTVSTGDVLTRASDAATFLIEFGEIEAALADQLCPDRDTFDPQLARLRGISRDAGRAFIAGHAVNVDLTDLRLPDRVEISVPEGYAWYALTPAAYMEPAERFWWEKQPATAVVIGIRSIGTSLSAVVAAMLEQHGCRVESFTLRPRGHPFQREVILAEPLRQALKPTPNAFYAIVDEGPGLSGSSFASVAEALVELGIAEDRIVFMPAWLPDGSGFVSRSAGERWRAHTKYGASSARPENAQVDLSAGRWREILLGAESHYPAVQPQHETAKFLNGEGLVRFAGLGRYGREKLARARLLSAAGFSTRPVVLKDGWLTMEFVPGKPLRASDADEELLETMARYIAFRGRAFSTGESACTDPLREMIGVNLGRSAPNAPAAEAVITDGRMMPHEWIATARGRMKTDALDHGDNHFQPGPADICWDLAGVMIEWQLEESARDLLLNRYVRESHDRRVSDRLPFYLLAYSAFRAGYSDLATRALPPSPDRQRFGRLRERYLRGVEEEAAMVR